PGAGDVRDEQLLRGPAPVDGGLADAGAGGHLVDAGGQAVLGEDLAGGVQDLLGVADGVRADPHARSPDRAGSGSREAAPRSSEASTCGVRADGTSSASTAASSETPEHRASAVV